MSGRRIFLHVGIHKTGSTAIQRFLTKNREYLGSRGFELYRGRYVADNHLELHLACVRGDRDSTVKAKYGSFDEALVARTVDDVRRFARTSPAEKLLFTSETLSLLRSPDELDRLRHVVAVGDESPTVIVYLRDRDRFLASLRRQYLRMGFGLSSDPASDRYVERDSWLADYDDLVASYRTAFGDDHLVVVDYDEVLAREGNVIPSFMRAVGLPGSAELKLAEFRNTTPTARPELDLLESEDFVRSRIWPAIAADDGRARGDVSFTTRVLRRNDRRGRAVAEYRFAEGARAVAKLYVHAAEARTAYAVQVAVWRGGFGSAEPYRVPRPIACLGDHGVIAMTVASGARLSEVPLDDLPAADESVRRAAQWLHAFHNSSLRLAPRHEGREPSRLHARRGRAVERHPELDEVLRACVDELTARCVETSAPRPTHGSYHPGHVFVAPDCVTVIRFDRAAMGDPSRDIATFLHRLRWDASEDSATSGRIDQLSDAFMTEYVGLPGGEAALSGLVYHWSHRVLTTLVRLASKSPREEMRFDERAALLLSEFDAVPERVGRWSAILGR